MFLRSLHGAIAFLAAHRDLAAMLLVALSFALGEVVNAIMSRVLPRIARRVHVEFGARAAETLRGPVFSRRKCKAQEAVS